MSRLTETRSLDAPRASCRRLTSACCSRQVGHHCAIASIRTTRPAKSSIEKTEPVRTSVSSMAYQAGVSLASARRRRSSHRRWPMAAFLPSRTHRAPGTPATRGQTSRRPTRFMSSDRVAAPPSSIRQSLGDRRLLSRTINSGASNRLCAIAGLSRRSSFDRLISSSIVRTASAPASRSGWWTVVSEGQ